MHSKKIHIIIMLAAMAAVVSAPFIGKQFISPAELLSDSLDGAILRGMRMPRVLTGLLAGCILSFSGACFQALFRNNLASPYTLGLSGGASLGVALTAWLGLSGGIYGIGTSSIGAFTGAALVSIAVYAFSRFSRRGDGNAMLLAGVAVSFFTSSMIMFVQYAGREGELYRVMRWMSGSLAVSGYAPVLLLLPLCLAALAVSLFGGGTILDLLSTGDDFAASRGINLKIARLSIFGGISLMTGMVVAVCGPIGFVGLICPHMARCLTGAQNTKLIPYAMLLGGAMLAICDTIGRSVAAGGDIPAGIITSLAGAPFFIFQLSTAKK